MVIKKGRVHLPSMVRISIYGKDTGGMKGREAYVSLFHLCFSMPMYQLLALWIAR